MTTEVEDTDDDFMPSGHPYPSKTLHTDERQILAEKPILDHNKPTTDVTSTSSVSSTTMSMQKRQTSMTQVRTAKPPKPTRSLSGMEDVFTHAQVRTWSEV